MNDMLTFGFFAAAGIAGATAFTLFHVYSGISGNLSSANVGEVYNFEYLQPKNGDPKRFMVKVLSVNALTDEQISRLNRQSNYRRYDSEFQRTNHLVTGQSADGTIRNFYAERVVNCRRPLLAPSLFKAGVAHLFF